MVVRTGQDNGELKEYYFVITLNDGYLERIPYKNVTLKPFIPRFNYFLDRKKTVDLFILLQIKQNIR